MDTIVYKKKTLPNKPGVYFFLGKQKEILYIGKATSLKHRVKSYFDSNLHEKRSVLIEKMVAEAKSIEWMVTDSVLEAMLLEVNLIRTHKPTYNTISKDDKSYNHLVITDEAFPRVLVVRSKDLIEKFEEGELKYIFGPFPNGALFRDALKIIRKLFQFYDTAHPIDRTQTKMERGKIDFNRQIGLYPDVQSKYEYARTIRHIRLFFEWKKSQIIKELERAMMRAAKNEEFEEAHTFKRKIFALKHIHDIALMKDEHRVYRDDRTMRIEAYDVAHLGGTDMVGVMTVIERGEPKRSEYRKFKIKSLTGANDPGALREILQRRLDHPEWPYPQLIVVDGSTAQKRTAEHELHTRGILIPVVGVVKDEKHNPKRIIGSQKIISEHEEMILHANAEAHRFAISYHRAKRSVRYKTPT